MIALTGVTIRTSIVPPGVPLPPPPPPPPPPVVKHSPAGTQTKPPAPPAGDVVAVGGGTVGIPGKTVLPPGNPGNPGRPPGGAPGI